MSDVPRFGQHAPRDNVRPPCSKHPHSPAVAYCKRCNRPACQECAIQTEVGSVCVDCAKPARRSRIPGALVGSSNKVTLWIIAACVVAFVVNLMWSGLNGILAFNPIVAATEPWRFFTTSFAHAGFLHLLFNMLMLYLIGSAVERASGHWRFAALYFLSALGGSVAVVIWTLVQPESLTAWTVGASGALYGLFGAVFVEQKRAGISTTSIIILLVINLVYSFTGSGISWQAHIGGLIVGGLMAWIYTAIGVPRRGTSGGKQTGKAIGATVLAAALLFAIAYGVYFVHPNLVF